MIRRLTDLPRTTQLLLILLFVVILGSIFFFLPLPEKSFFWRALQNSGHGAIFGCTSLVMVWLAHVLLKRWSRWLHYLLAFIVTAGLGLLTEIIQRYIGRDASWDDFFRDCVGTWSVLLVITTIDPFLDPSEKRFVRKQTVTLWIVAIVSMVGVFLPTLDWGIAALYRTAQLPVLCDFDSRWERKFVFVNDAHKEFAPWPPTAEREPENLSLKLTFWPTEYPTFALEEPHPDWTAYDTLIFYIFSPLGRPVKLDSRIHDIHHDESYADRWNGELAVEPGVNRYAIPLPDIMAGPARRDLDMRHIMSFKLFSHYPADSFTVFVDSIYLK